MLACIACRSGSANSDAASVTDAREKHCDETTLAAIDYISLDRDDSSSGPLDSLQLSCSALSLNLHLLRYSSTDVRPVTRLSLVISQLISRYSRLLRCCRFFLSVDR
jgi:hypothetical protein